LLTKFETFETRNKCLAAGFCHLNDIVILNVRFKREFSSLSLEIIVAHLII